MTTQPGRSVVHRPRHGRTPRPRSHSHVTVWLSVAGSRIQIDVDGRIGIGRGALVFRRRVPHQALYAAALMRASLASAGIAVRDDARVGPTPALHAGRARPLLALHESAPLGVLLRKINKDSDNEQAERVLRRRAPRSAAARPRRRRGWRSCARSSASWACRPNSYVPRNGSGLGHANRITADAMAELLRALYLDPRVGPRSCSRSRWAASTARPATGSRARWRRGACAPRPARCAASRACRGWWATGRRARVLDAGAGVARAGPGGRARRRR